MPNVLFKRGLQSALASTTAVDGVFYLTTDTHRLYVGQGDTKVLLNQTVQIVSSINDLTSLSDNWSSAEKQAHTNDFYYITGTGENGEYSNILVVWNGTTWVQINADHNTELSSVEFVADAASNTGEMTIKIKDSENATQSATFAIQGTHGIGVTSTTGTLVLEGTEYKLSNDINANPVNSANLYLNASINNTTTAVSTIALFAGENSNVQFQGTSAGLSIITSDTTLSSASMVLAATGSLGLTIKDSENATYSTTVANVGIGLNDGAYLPIINTTGKTAGAIYSKDEIDDKLRGLNGISYKGTLGSSGAEFQQLPTTANNGDLYLITESGANASSTIFQGATLSSSTSAELSNKSTAVGDFVIAVGTEDSDGILSGNALQWTYVPAGNDDLDYVTYTASANAGINNLTLKNAAGSLIGAVQLTAGTNIALSSTAISGTTLETVINHAAITTTAVEAATLSTEASSFTAIKSITVDNGHVTNIETDTYTPYTYDLAGATATNGTRKNSNGDGVNVVSTVIGLVDSNGTPHTSATMSLNSETLVLSAATATAGQINIDMVWGTF